MKEIRDLCAQHKVPLDDKKLIVYSSKGLTSTVGWFGLEVAGAEHASVYDAGIKNWYQNFEDKLSPDAVEHLQY